MIGFVAKQTRQVTAQEHPIKGFDIFVQPVDPNWDYWLPSVCCIDAEDTESTAFAAQTALGRCDRRRLAS